MFLSALNTNYDHLIVFRSFVREHGRVKLRRVLHALDHNHSKLAIAHQLALPLSEITDLADVYRRTA